MSFGVDLGDIDPYGGIGSPDGDRAPTKVIYVGVPGATVRVAAGRLVVDSPDGVALLSVPAGHVRGLALCGPVGLSAGARNWALRGEVDVVFASWRGQYLGHLAGSGTRRVERLRALLGASDDPGRAVTFGRAVVTAKLSMQAVLLHRSRRQERHDQVDAAILGIIRSIDTVAGATSRDEIMGAEGAAARAYFAALGALLPAPLRFATRSRRPPLDVINSALSFGYTLLLGEAVTTLTAAGLDPAIGLLHTPADRRPSLALDLIEEFRPYVVDQVVLHLARTGRLGLEHGSEETDRAGVLLNREGRAVLIDAYEQRMATVTRSALPGFTGSIRRHLHRQAQRLAAWVERDVPWDGLEWR